MALPNFDTLEEVKPDALPDFKSLKPIEYSQLPDLSSLRLTPYEEADLASMSAGRGKPETGMEAGTGLTTALARGIPRDLAGAKAAAGDALASLVDIPPNLYNRLKGFTPDSKGYVAPIGKELISDAATAAVKPFVPIGDVVNAAANVPGHISNWLKGSKPGMPNYSEPKDTSDFRYATEAQPDDSFLVSAVKEAAGMLLSIPGFIGTPLGAATVGIGGAIKAAATPIRYAFASDMLGSMFQQAPELYQNWGKMTPGEKGKAITQFLGTGAMAALLTHPEWSSKDRPTPAQGPPATGEFLQTPEGIVPPPSKGDINAVPIRKPAQIPLEEPTANSPEVDQGISQPEKPADAQSQAAPDVPTQSTPVTPQEAKEQSIIARIKQGIKPENVWLSIGKDPAVPQASYVQVDELPHTDESLTSTNPNTMRKHGFEMPDTDTLLKLPQGQYSLPQALELLKKQEGNKPVAASDAPPEQSVQSANGPAPTMPDSTAPVKSVARGVRGIRIFDRETELNGPDILSWIKENGSLLSKAAAKRLWGKEKFNLNKSLWDDSVTLSKPHHNFAIYSDRGSGPDRVAQAAYDARQLKEPSVNALWEAIRKASKARAKAFEGATKEASLLEHEAKQVEDWQKAVKEGEKRVPVSALKVGDFMEVDGEHVEVTHIDADSGDVTLKDGSKFGTQTVSDGKTLHVEKYEPSPESGEFVPKAGGELFPPQDTPFNLAGEKVEMVPPKTTTTTFGNQTLAQDELFGIQKVVESKDPGKSADAAQKMYGGPKEAVAKLENQLRVVDSDPQTKKSFSKEQRERLRDVISLLRERDRQRGTEYGKASKVSDAFDRARKGDESAFDDLDSQFRQIYPEPEELERRPDPNTVHTPQAFKSLFDKAFAARDFDSILDAIKATSDKSVWKPYLQELFSKQATDQVAAKKAEWFRHVFNGTRPADAIPRPTPKPSATPPRPGHAPRPKPSGPPPPPPSPPPVRIPVEPIVGGTPKSPYQIINDFSAAIGKAIRVLRMKRNGLGVYRPGSTLTAEKFAGDLDTAAHELAGHWTDDKYGVGKPWIAPRTRSPYDSELAKFWIHGSVTPRSSLAYRRAEGIAEFIRAYVVNPKQAKLDAPTFSAYFERTLPPEALKSINDFGIDVRTWAGADPLARAGMNIRMNPPTLRERLWSGLRGRGFGFEVSPIDRLRLWFDDPYHYAVKAFHESTALRGLPIKPQDNFELLSRLLSTHDARMSDQFEHGLVPLRPKQIPDAAGNLQVERLLDPVTSHPMTMEWLLDAFDKSDMEKMNQDMRDASAFMVAQRTMEKGVQLGRPDNVSGIGAGIMSDKQAAQELLRRVAADPPRQARLAEAARRYRLWADQNLNMLVESGRMSAEQAGKMRADNQFYVDMHRLSQEFDSGNKATRTKGIGTTRDLIKRFKGSTLELDNVYSNLLEQTDAIQKEAHRNVTMRAFTDALTEARTLHGPDLKDYDQFGRKVSSQDRNTIRVFDNGKGEFWQFDPDIYESLKGLGELGTHAFIDILAIPSRLARYVITHGPQFMARNVVRDTFERSVNSRNASKPWDILQGYSEKDLSRYEVFGGGQFGNYIVDRHVWNRELTKVMRDLSKDPSNILLSPLKLKHGWEALAEKSEKIGRIAEFRRAFERGKTKLGYDDYNAALYAAGEARGLLDFAKAGTVMRVINRLVPFSNARVRGLARATFAFKEDPAKFALKWGMFVLTPTILTMLYNRSSKENWGEYQQQPAYLRDFFWNFKVGPYWLRIPRPHELGVMAGGVERAISALIGDKHSMEGYTGSAANAALPIQNPVEGTGPLKTLLELEFNRDTFRNRDIVPAWEKDLKLELRKGTKYASGTGKGIAGAINSAGLSVDPRQVDFLLQSYGGLGQLATSLTTKNRTLPDAFIKGTGFVAEPPGTAARDVQWVIDWAKTNGKLQDYTIKHLQELRKSVMDEPGATMRNIKSRKLIAYASQLRQRIESR